MRKRGILAALAVFLAVSAWGGTTPVGFVYQSNGAKISGVKAVGGLTVFDGDTVTVGSTGGVVIALNGGSRVLLAPNSEARFFRQGQGFQVRVKRGRVEFDSSPRSLVEGFVAGTVFRPVSASESSTGLIHFSGGNTHVPIGSGSGSGRLQFAAEKGNWMLAANNRSVMVRPGEEMAAELTKSAGHVAVVVARVLLARGTEKLPAKPQEPVYWGDVVNTIQLARARIALNDGSVLNVGPSSSLKIVQENAAAQQTQLQLIYGRVRSKVMHITKPNGKFQIRSRLGVAGVVGTDFYLALEGNTLQLVVFEGVVHFCNLAGVCVNVRRNQSSMIMVGMPPTTPTQASKGLLLEAQNSTRVPSSVALRKPAGAGVNQQPTNAEVQKKKHHRKVVVLLTAAGVATGIGFAAYLDNEPGSSPKVASPVIP